MKPTTSRIYRWRLLIQLVALVFSLGWLLAVIWGVKTSIHALCMYSTVCFGLGKGGDLISAGTILAVSVLVSLVILILTVFRGREFCSYLCPLGTVQDLLFKFRNRPYRKQHRFPVIQERKFSPAKYGVLFTTVFLALFGFAYAYIRLCPLYTLSLLPRMLAPGLGVLVLLVILPGLFMERFWCRFICPYAALMNIFQALGELFGIKRRKIKRNLERCIDCGLCCLHCPMNIYVTETETVQSLDCIHCQQCVCNCPKPGTLSSTSE